MNAVTPIAIAVVLVIAGAIFFVVARRILRIALKLAFAMAIIFLLVVGAGVGWWRGWFSSSTRSAPRPTVTSNQHANTNRRKP